MTGSECVVGILSEWAATNPQPDASIARERAVAALKDGIACIFSGARDKATQAVLRSTISSHGKGDFFALGQEVYLSMAGAALVNGTAAHALDFDDNFIPATSHATAVLTPALLAVGQWGNRPGHRIVDAYILGLELQARISALINPHHYNAGWHATATNGTIGTAGALACLLDFSADQIAMAMSIGFSLASGSKLQFGTMTKPAHAGFAAHNAVTAVSLVSSGLTAQKEFLTGRWSYQDLFGAGADFDAGVAVTDLGNTWSIITTGLAVKRFPCCGAVHKALDALEGLMQSEGFILDDVETITAHLPDALFENLRFDCPQTASEARFSFAYPAARLMTEGRISLAHFTDEAVQNPEIQSILGKFRREKTDFVPTSMNFRQKITVRLKNGREIVGENYHVRGSIENPLSTDEMDSKFRDCLHWSGNEDKLPLLGRLKTFDS
ncbi:MAG: MmgE/PrpD family protein, partial [Sneathiellales bacterium]|nr:MmgE/PrpD family protein [Sneathiellales bacterium]